jgi:NTP pyrophosphatase (non-canonical NTP hydrolase)
MYVRERKTMILDAEAIKTKGKIEARVKEAHRTATEKGWHDEPREFGTVIALMHAEVTEAQESVLPGGQNNFTEELADVLIRMYDACGEFNIPLDTAETLTRERRSEIENGFYELLCLHMYLSYALETFRKEPEEIMWKRVAEHFAEVHVAIYEISEKGGLDIDAAIEAKMAKNKTRPHRHGGKRA